MARKRIELICRSAGYRSPIIRTSDELSEVQVDELPSGKSTVTILAANAETLDDGVRICVCCLFQRKCEASGQSEYEELSADLLETFSCTTYHRRSSGQLVLRNV